MAGAADRLRGRCTLDGVFPEGEVVINIRVVQRLAIEHLGTGADVCELLRRLRTGETDEHCLVSATAVHGCLDGRAVGFDVAGRHLHTHSGQA